MSGPIAVKVGDKTFEISAATLAPAISFPADAEGRITPTFDDKVIIAAVTKAREKAGATKRGQGRHGLLRERTALRHPVADGSRPGRRPRSWPP